MAPHVAHLHQRELGPGGHQADGVAGLDGALKHADINDDALVAVVDAVKDQSLEGASGSPVGAGMSLTTRSST